MALTASTLIDDAVLAAAPYAAPHFVAPGPLLRQLSQLEDEILTELASVAPERVAAFQAAVPVVTVTNATGYALSAAKSYGKFFYIDEDDNVFPEPIQIVPEADFHNPDRHPSGIVRLGGSGAAFFPCDPLGKNWVGAEAREFFVGDGDSLLYSYVPNAVRVTALAQSLLSPDEARAYIQEALTLSILTAAGAPLPRLQAHAAALQMAKAQLWLQMMKRTGTSSRVGA